MIDSCRSARESRKQENDSYAGMTDRELAARDMYRGLDGRYYTQEWLDGRCADWQRRLRLQDWAINSSFERAENMETCWGKNTVFAAQKACSIRLLQPCERHDDNEYVAPGVEETLIHELLHLHFLPWATNDSEDPDYLVLEQGITAIAQALAARE